GRWLLAQLAQRQAHDEGRAAPRSCALGMYRPAVQVDQVTHDCQAETQATVGARARAVRLPEAVEHVRQELAADARPRVADADLGIPVRHPHPDIDPSAL